MRIVEAEVANVYHVMDKDDNYILVNTTLEVAEAFVAKHSK